MDIKAATARKRIAPDILRCCESSSAAFRSVNFSYSDLAYLSQSSWAFSGSNIHCVTCLCPSQLQSYMLLLISAARLFLNFSSVGRGLDNFTATCGPRPRGSRGAVPVTYITSPGSG